MMRDKIYRQDAIDEIENLPSAEHHKLNIAEYIHDQYPDVWRHAEKELEVPSAERKGHWEYLYDGNYKCSNCGSWWVCEDVPCEEGLNYCPNCGASMVRGEKE